MSDHDVPKSIPAPRQFGNDEGWRIDDGVGPKQLAWSQTQPLSNFGYVCGYCGSDAAPSQCYHTVNNSLAFIVVCPRCTKPTFIWNSQVLREQQRFIQEPGILYGKDVEHLPPDIDRLYTEARRCAQNSAYTGTVLLCRKLLMSVAVSQGAEGNRNFAYYISYIINNHLVPANAHGWIDHIRQKGNEATHELPLSTQEDVDDILSFAEMLLKLIYEFPARRPSST